MLGVIAVVEPGPVVEPVVRADAPRDRRVGIALEVFVVAVQRRQRVAEKIERHEREERAPVIDEAGEIDGDDGRDLDADPARERGMLFLQARVALAAAVAKVAVERIRPRALGLSILAVPIDRERIDRGAVRADAVHVADVMTQVDVVIELLRKAVGQRQNEAVDAIERRRDEERVVDEVMADRIDAPRDRDRIDQRERNPHRPWHRVKAEEQERDEREVPQSHQHREKIPRCVREESRRIVLMRIHEIGVTES